MKKKYLIVGAGFSGSVLAHELCKHSSCQIDVWDERNHVGGNCHTKRDEETGIMVHEYGPHIFNTDKKEIWDFVNSFVEFKPFINRVKANYRDNIYSLPVNLHTINQFFGKSFGPDEAREFINSLGDKTITEPASFEEQALKFLGMDLYKAFFYGYTKKQWGCEPSALPASILKRLPVRFNYNDNYYNNSYQGIPVNGYTELVEKLLDHPDIRVSLNKKFQYSEALQENYDHIFYTGPVDAFFDYKYGKLGYRTVTFEKYTADGDHQGNAVINYCDESVPYTRIHEHKHFAPWEQHDKTVYFKEFSKETTEQDIPYYPKRLESDKEILNAYRAEALRILNISFLGRLATYRYMDMHHVIGEAILFAASYLLALQKGENPPVFPNTED
ncbi:MAG: UDP-galactopyranose mutase [Chitinophagaceae bacterium]|nr:UDP-galactopyranose mutase [Chitinophagaceae bacterium]